MLDDVILKRRSYRTFASRPVEKEVEDKLLTMTLRAPSGGNMQLWSMIRVTDPEKKALLARTCDNQAFIAKAPLVYFFLSDTHKWIEYFKGSKCDEKFGKPIRNPGIGDFHLGMQDAMAAAQTCVLAAESLGLRSCYIGDIIENYETVKEAFHLPTFAAPACLLVIGYPKEEIKAPLLPRPDNDAFYFTDEYPEITYEMMEKILSDAKISYVKWDMNRSITECYSSALPSDRQGEVYHRYILGVYDLYERLTSRFLHVLFESCASGGGRFDPGLLYYAPQGWTSDDTDAVERLKIQYGTSYCYPVSSMGSHVSVTPNHQLNRNTPLYTRANVAYFGTFGYELDLNRLTGEELEEVKEQVRFMKKYRRLIQYGTFYRLQSPFENNVAGWMVVSSDRREALVGRYKILNGTNQPFERMYLKGLDEGTKYLVNGNETHYGDELMHCGLVTTDASAGETAPGEKMSCDFDSELYVIEAV